MRAARSSKLVSALAVLGLIVISTVMVIFLNNSLLVTSVREREVSAQGSGPISTGILLVQLFTNQNESGGLPNPTNTVSALGNQALFISQNTNSSTAISAKWFTDVRGDLTLQETPGPYLVTLTDQTVKVRVPVEVTANNETDLAVTVYGAAYPLVYSEESGAVLTADGIQSNIYVELRSYTAAANVGDPVILDVDSAGPGIGHLVNATVVGLKPPAQGTQWLELGAAGTVNTVDATSVVLTTWTYLSQISVLPVGSNVNEFFG